MSSSYTAFAPTKPIGTDTGPNFATSANANDLVNWYAVVQGLMPGYVYSVTVGTGSALQPQFIYAKNGAYWVRFTNTWGTSGGANGNLTQQVVDVSQDTGSTYANVCTQTFTYDASGNLSSSTGAAGLLALLLPQLGRVTTLTGSFNTHTAATGTAVHGLGTMSTQAATAVNIDGGTVDGALIGSVTPAVGVFLQARGKHVSPSFGTTTTLDWSQGDSFDFTATGSGAATLAFSNVPASGISSWITLTITNGGLWTWTWPTGTKWPAGTAPALSSSGRDRINFFTRDGGSTFDGFYGIGMA